MNRRGNVFTDTIVVIVLLTIFAIVFVSGNKILVDINTDMQLDSDLSPEAKQAMATVNDQYVILFDGTFLTLLVLLWVVTIVASFKIDTHPIFFIFVFILLAIAIYIGGEMSNAYQELMQDEDLAVSASQFTMTNILINHYIMVVMIIGFSISISLFAKIWYLT